MHDAPSDNLQHRAPSCSAGGPLQLIAYALAFGGLLFLASVATFALEQSGREPDIWRLAPIVLAVLHGVCGFFIIGGPAACADGDWLDVTGIAGASSVAAVTGAAAAFLAARVAYLPLPADAALVLIAACLAAGSAGLVLAVRCPGKGRRA